MDKPEKKIRIVIADDHRMFRQGLRHLLETESDFVIVGEAADGQEAVNYVVKFSPDILLLDLAMPKLPGLEALRQIAQRVSSVRTLLLTASFNKTQLVEALQLGARGAVLKELSAEVLIKAIRCVHGGEYWVDRASMAAWARSSDANLARNKQFGLTTREREITAEITAGATNRDVAAKFSISEETVKRHLSNIYDKLGVSNRLELALYALHHKLVSE
jgi:DNA-binding NarL/FixJ family response regulator